MTVNELIQELSKLPEELREQKLMVGDESLEIKFYTGWKGTRSVLMFNTKSQLLMVASGLPQPQEQVKPKSGDCCFDSSIGCGCYCALDKDQ